VVELNEWDFIVDAQHNVFLLGCNRSPDLQNNAFLAQKVFNSNFLLFNNQTYSDLITGKVKAHEDWRLINNMW